MRNRNRVHSLSHPAVLLAALIVPSFASTRLEAQDAARGAEASIYEGSYDPHTDYDKATPAKTTKVAAAPGIPKAGSRRCT
jgi:hypothetical protein